MNPFRICCPDVSSSGSQAAAALEAAVAIASLSKGSSSGVRGLAVKEILSTNFGHGLTGVTRPLPALGQKFVQAS